MVRDAHFPWLDPAGSIAESERNIFIFTISLAAIVVIPVYIMLFVFALRYREGSKKAKYKPEWHHNTWLEVAWWGIPILIIAILAVTVWITTHRLDPYNAIESDAETVEVQVVALEWKWLFIYPDYGIATVNELKLPANTPIHLTLAADAPMSAFWVPSLGSQIYSMNGMSSQLNLIAKRLGNYKGYNTNINGEGYSKMDFDVPVVRSDEFVSWASRVAKSKVGLGEAEYERLAKPSVENKPLEYRLLDSELYDMIIMKYMSPMDMGKEGDKQHEAIDMKAMNEHDKMENGK